VLPLLMGQYLGPGLLGLGVTAMIAGFMSGMAGNVSAFATVWTYDVYRPLLVKNANDKHYLNMGRWCSILGVLFSIGTAYLCFAFSNILDTSRCWCCCSSCRCSHGDHGHALETRHARGRVCGLPLRDPLLHRHVCLRALLSGRLPSESKNSLASGAVVSMERTANRFPGLPSRAARWMC